MGGAGPRGEPGGTWGCVVGSRVGESEDMVRGQDGIEDLECLNGGKGRDSRFPHSLSSRSFSPRASLTVSRLRVPRRPPLSPLPSAPTTVPSQCPSRSPPSMRPGDGDPRALG